MKPLLIFITILLTCSAHAQTYEMDAVNGQTINTCSGTFFDSQAITIGTDLYYGPGEYYTVTFCSSTPGDAIRIDFSFLQTVAGEDTLWVYDGASTASPLMTYFSGGYGPESVVGANGCLTFVFQSTGGFVSLGWEGAISCFNIPPVPLQPGCTNMGFDTGDFTGWYGTYSNSVSTGPAGAPTPNYIPDVYNSTASAFHTITSGAGLDPWGGFPVVSPTGGPNSMMLGDGSVGGNGGATIEQKFSVTAANAMMVYSYAVVIQNALDVNGNPHLPEQQPFFKIEAYDCNDDPIDCGQYLVVGGPNINGFTASPFNADVFYKPWTDVFLDLTPYIGTCVTVRFTSADCTLGAHWAYVYLDAVCGPMEITGPQYICPGTTATLDAPAGGAAYSWTPGGETTESITVSPASLTSYSCTITSVAGPLCTTTLNYDVDVYPTETNAVNSETICEGESATLTSTPSVTGGTFTWNPGGQTTSSITVSPTSTTTYTNTYTDPNGCDVDAQGTVTVNPLPALTVNNPAAVCEPNTVDITGSFTDNNGTTGNITYWQDAGATIPLTDPNNIATSGTYYIVKETNNGCSDTVSVVATINPLPTPNAGVDDTVCNGLVYPLSPTTSIGTGTWTGPAGLTFAPNATSPVATVTANAPGTYTLTWTETSNGCTASDDVEISLSNMSYVENVTPATCGSNNGEIELTVSNGVPPYTYSIDNGVTTQTSNVFTNLADATYDIWIEDNLGCQITGTATVTEIGGPTIISINAVDVNCNGACDGSISINANGATIFSIDNGLNTQASNNFTNLCPGTYDILVEDALGCQATDVATITEPTLVTAVIAPVNLDCYQVCTGELNISASGGTPGYQYSIDNGNTFTTNNQPNNLCAGSYDIIVQDALGCQYNSQVDITEPTQLTATLGSTDESCFGACDGTVSVTVPNGSATAPYTYQWTGVTTGQNDPFVTGQCTGNYSVTITDDNGCTYTDNVDVNGPNAVTIDNVVTTDELCGGDCQGTITITATGATQYSIDGTNYSPNNVFTGLCAGAYTVYASDANGCAVTAPAVISGPTPVTVQVNGTPSICIGGTATITATPSGGTPGYTYSWSDTQGNTYTTQTINVSPSATEVYTVTATDQNGCSGSNSFIVSVNPPLDVLAFSDVSICVGESADISALASGGDGGPYTYNWDQNVGQGQFQSVSPTQTTVYTVTATDGCETPAATASVTITVNPLPTISFLGDTLNGCVPLTVNFEEFGVPAGSQCLWSFGDGGASTSCGTTTYEFTQPGCWDVSLSIITPEGCQTDVTIPSYICVFPYPTADFSFVPQPTTVLDPTILFTNLSSGATTYEWNIDPDGADYHTTTVHPTYTFPGDVPGTYDVCLLAISPEGCIDTTCKPVEISEEFLVYVPNAFTPDGVGPNNIFTPVVTGVDPLEYEFLVFNRWGELIFESNHPTIGWDGRYKGIMSQTDVYVWKLKVKDLVYGKKHEYIGHVTLLK